MILSRTVSSSGLFVGSYLQTVLLTPSTTQARRSLTLNFTVTSATAAFRSCGLTSFLSSHPLVLRYPDSDLPQVSLVAWLAAYPYFRTLFSVDNTFARSLRSGVLPLLSSSHCRTESRLPLVWQLSVPACAFSLYSFLIPPVSLYYYSFRLTLQLVQFSEACHLLYM